MAKREICGRESFYTLSVAVERTIGLCNQIDVGDKVYYHPIINLPHDNVVRSVKAVGELSHGEPVAWLNGKSGCVAIRALTKV